jgi:large-conductance mechanosensitive channel
MSMFFLDVVIWPFILIGGGFLLFFLGIIGLAVFLAVRIIKNERKKNAEPHASSTVESAEEPKEL